MKIGLVCPYNLYKGGGVQECVFALQTALADRGHQVLIITPQSRTFPDVLPPFVRPLGSATDVKSLHTTSQVSISADPTHISDLLETEQFDILHFHEPWVPLLSRQLLSRSKAKHVATFHAKLPDTMVTKTLEKVVAPYTRSILKYLDSLTAVSDAAAEYVRSLTDDEVIIIPNGIDVKKYQNKATTTKPYILYIGRLERRKGVKYLLEAFAKLQHVLPNYELIIAGDGPERMRLEEQTSSAKLTGVHFVGYVSEAEKLKLLKQASLFCSPAVYGESFGIVLLEALAAGIPIVAADNPGYSTVLKERGLISLINVKDIDNFARRLELLLSDQTLRRTWQDWAQNYITQFDYQNVVDEYETLYKRVLKS